MRNFSRGGNALSAAFGRVSSLPVPSAVSTNAMDGYDDYNYPDIGLDPYLDNTDQ